MTENKVAVEQCDREAAADYLLLEGGVRESDVRKIRSGLRDNDNLVQSYARHRTRALEASQAGEHPCRHEWYQGQCVHCEILVKDYRTTPTRIEAAQPQEERDVT